MNEIELDGSDYPFTADVESCLLKAIALDFDGVILESVEIKTRAFRALFKDYPEHIERIVRLHREQAGVSRYEKFETIYREYLQLPLSDVDKDRLGREFSALVAEEMLACPFVPGALEFLAREAGHRPIFLVSGTPEAELREIVKLRKLDRYFDGVLGSPRSKDALLKEILSAQALGPAELLVVGDAMTDFTAARAVGAHFIGRVPLGVPNPFPIPARLIVSDLSELKGRWNAILADLA